MNRLIHNTIVFLVLLLPVFSNAQTATEELKKKANKLFDKEQYVEATPLYSRILPLDPRDSEMNFKYGACLLYNSYRKGDALKYLEYAVKSVNIDPRAHFFLAKGLHLDYQFEAAVKKYQKYISVRKKADPKYDAERGIQMCENGTRLLSSFTDIVVAEKQEVEALKFYKMYTDKKIVGGDILVSAQFQSKLDKKMGHFPIVHFSPNTDVIYYASYGNDLKTGKDIFVRQRLSDGTWGDPQALPGMVNTDEDEDFPYMHPSGEYLYFSSKGHNSMGGYDVFVSQFDPVQELYGRAKNVDFAISSPDDDLFYIVDSLFENAYFTSARQSQDGKVHVYRVKVARVPMKNIVVVGDFKSEIDPGLHALTIKLFSTTDDARVGTVRTDVNGAYSFVFPQNGTYNCEIAISGDSKVYRQTIEIPIVDEFRPIKQRITHMLDQNGDEVIELVNLLDENVYGSSAVMARLLREKAQLEVNLDAIDLDAIEVQNQEDKMLSELGFQGMSSAKIIDFLDALLSAEKEKDASMNRILKHLENDILALSQQVISIDKQEKVVADSARRSTSELLKYDLLVESRQLQSEKNGYIDQIRELEELQKEIGVKLDKEGGDKLFQVVDAFKRRYNESELIPALEYLVEHKEVLMRKKHPSTQSLLDSYVSESIRIRNGIAIEDEKLNAIQTSIDAIDLKLENLASRVSDARKKDKEGLQLSILETEQELEITQELFALANEKKRSLEFDRAKVERRIETLQEVIVQGEDDLVNLVDDELTTIAVEEIANQIPTDYESELEVLNALNTELPENVDRDMDGSNSSLDSVLESEEKSSMITQPEESDVDLVYTVEKEKVDLDQLKQSVVSEIAPKYVATLAHISNLNVSDFQKRTQISNAESEVLERLRIRKQQLESKKGGTDADGMDQLQLDVVEQLILEHELILDEILAEGIEMLTSEDRSQLIAVVDRRYEKDVKLSSTPEETVFREELLQQKIKNEIDQLNKKYSKSPKVSIDLLRNAYELLLSESEDRRKQIANTISTLVPNALSKEEFIISQRENAMGKEYNTISIQSSTLAQLSEQEEVLTVYLKVLETEIFDIQQSKSTDASNRKLMWLREEKALVEGKRKSVRMSIGELETVRIENTPTTDTQSTVEETVNEQSNTLVHNDSLDDKFEGNQVSITPQDLEENVFSNPSEEFSLNAENRAGLMQEFSEDSVLDAATVSRVKSFHENEEAKLTELFNLAAAADSKAEKNYLLREAQEQNDRLNDKITEAVNEAKVASIEKSSDITLVTRGELKRQRRNYSVRLGAVEQEILRNEEAISIAKKRDVPELELKKKDREIERDLLKNQLERIDLKLSKIPTTDVVISNASRNKELTFKEEQRIAGSKEYQNFYPLANAALKVENEIRILELTLEDNRVLAHRIITEGRDRKDLDQITRKIKRLESELANKQLNVRQKKYLSDQALPKNREEAMKMQNIAARGILPIKAVATAATILSMPLSGLTIDLESELVNDGAREVPIGIDHPSGLVYRVQIGAFSKPIPPNVFKEFNPVSGEKIEGTSITRYMAGFFNSSDDVVDAKTTIRSLGYSDAFVVAYCDGKRVPFGVARKLQASGECVPKGLSEMIIEVAENTASVLGVPVSREVPELKELEYMLGPGAVDADPVEPIKGLFFTVQVGVFNTSVRPEDVSSLPEMITYRLPNGLIRYSTGYFDSKDEARSRLKMARDSGVQDAFITAYYNGKRISIAKAQNLLIEFGTAILKSSKDQENLTQENLIENKKENQMFDLDEEKLTSEDVPETPIQIFEEAVQVVTKASFDRFPRDVLNRYNMKGSFYFDKKDKKVKSVIYRNADRLPNIWKFRNDVDTVYLQPNDWIDTTASVLSVTFADSIVQGDFMDFLLRFEHRREVQKNVYGVEIRIFDLEPESLEALMDRMRLYGIEPRLIYEGK